MVIVMLVCGCAVSHGMVLTAVDVENSVSLHDLKNGIEISRTNLQIAIQKVSMGCAIGIFEEFPGEGSNKVWVERCGCRWSQQRVWDRLQQLGCCESVIHCVLRVGRRSPGDERIKIGF